MARFVNSCVLVAEPEPTSRETLRALLSSMGCAVDTAQDLRGALSRLQSAIRYELVLSTPRLAGGDVLELLPRLKALEPAPTLLLVVERSELPTVVRLLRLGAAACIGKPLLADEVRATVEHHLEHRRLRQQCETLRAALARQKRSGKLIAEDPAMEAVLQRAEPLCATRSPVLVTGGPGSGKRTLAEWIHAQSPRHRAPCIYVDGAGAPADALWERLRPADAQSGDLAGALAEADEGTLIIGHLEKLPGELQGHVSHLADLLRPTGGRGGPAEGRARIIFTTGSNPEKLVAAGALRKDLFYALTGFRVDVPDLKDRPRDISPLARQFLRAAAARLEVEPPHLERKALAALLQHAWPGNVRELEHLMDALVASAVEGRITLSDVSSALRAPVESNGRGRILSLREALAEPERQIVERALRLNDGNRQKTAEMLQINRSTLFSKMRKYGLLEGSEQ